ncbi:Fumarylacetoacetate hydrolase [Taphrina deformans PYCC 5710]|uniref:Fumarylacetoacetate hydrolase n=1 Tax=Taphrina deformans (strain PYCC 5710 / ATCC 11124 / CBS 356.35 / IMI 108563 / JCM 9778 / NBRC 8474) TaxID=1097556 RepID=R4XJ39_TAPDE|nr:Fumarylacetoacetate hydrolase [Taphrina deformans PYCC 5710]|eukprot:CCG83390.1 Fumarylacetoacetate hydrolase [Taphrina deformans PYCC 5710]
MSWTRAVRFIAKETKRVHLGQVRTSEDIALLLESGKAVQVQELEGDLYSGQVTDTLLTIDTILSPLESTGAIRCTGLNYIDHANEAGMPIPTDPVLFFKAGPALNGPGTVPIPRVCQDGSSDYEAELAIVLSRDAKDVPLADAMDYVLGFTCANDISSRTLQLSSSQWCFSKSMDGSCPIGPTLVRPSTLPDHGAALPVRCLVNGTTVQDGTTADFIFSVQHLVHYFSKGSTLQRGSLILTGTPAGIGFFRQPRIVLRHGDDVRVQIPGIGTLINDIRYE